MPAHLDQPDQVRALTRAFLARFFENEITTGTDDLKTSFFWLLSFLAVPGMFMPMLMSFKWQMLALVRGTDALRVIARGDKALYVGFAMIATAAVTAIAWNSLLSDRRDALVLGVLPVRPVTVVTARLAALAIYTVGIAVAMNALASVSFGFCLAARNTFAFALRGILAHFAASAAATMCVFLSVTGVQGVVLAVLGPRVFARVAPLLQVALVGLIAAGFLALPLLAGPVAGTLANPGAGLHPWMLATPPLWFLGIYERVLGTSDPVMVHLQRNAIVALVVCAAATLVSYPLAYRRVLSSVVEQGGGARRHLTSRKLSALLTLAIGRAPHLRAVSQFFLATIGRVETNRFIIAAAAGLVIAWVMPSWLSMASSRPEAPRGMLLSLSYSAMVFLVLGVAITASLPSDQKSAWIFDVTPPARRDARAALERTMCLFGVAPSLILFLPLYRALWGGSFAATHALFMLVMGLLVVQFALRRSEGMPCARPWDPQSLDLGRWWGAYLIGFILYTTKVPEMELALYGHPIGVGIFTAVALAAAAALRVRSLRRHIDDTDTSAFAPGDVLSLN